MNPVVRALTRHRLLPVAVIEDEATAPELAQVLADAGLPLLEITFRTSAARGALAAAAKSNPDVLLAAGTVVSKLQVEQALDAGAQCIVSPGLNREVVETCLAKGVPVFPGVCTPTEIEMARAYGLNTLKFFPAAAAGGLPMLRSLCSVYSDFKFIPTGGINLSNITDYLELPIVMACGGSWIVPGRAVKQRQFEQVSALVREAVTALG